MTFPSSASSVGHFVGTTSITAAATAPVTPVTVPVTASALDAQYFLRVNHGNGQPGAADHFSGRVGARDHASRRDCTQPRTLPRIRATKSRKRPDLRAVNMTPPPPPSGGEWRRAAADRGRACRSRVTGSGSGPRTRIRAAGVGKPTFCAARKSRPVGSRNGGTTLRRPGEETGPSPSKKQPIRARKNPPTCTSRRGDHWRWRRDLNPRLGVTQHSLSRRAPSAARTRHRERTYRSAPPADKSPGHGDSAQRNGPPRHAVARS